MLIRYLCVQFRFQRRSHARMHRTAAGAVDT